MKESHTEGERLRSALKEKTDDVQRFREENLRTVREDMEKERGELEELRARTKALEKRRREMMEELDEARQAKVKAEGLRREVEERWRGKVDEMKKEQEEKLKTLLREIQTLKEREEENEKEWRSKLEEARREVEQSRAELSEVKAMVAMLEEQKTHISSLAAEAEETDGQRRRSNQENNSIEKGRGGREVSMRSCTFYRSQNIFK